MRGFLTQPQVPIEWNYPSMDFQVIPHGSDQHLVHKTHRSLTVEHHSLMNGLVRTVLDLMVSDQSLEPEFHSMRIAEVAMEGPNFYSVLLDEGAVEAVPISVKTSEAE